jgi:hypothetical protein
MCLIVVACKRVTEHNNKRILELQIYIAVITAIERNKNTKNSRWDQETWEEGICSYQPLQLF